MSQQIQTPTINNVAKFEDVIDLINHQLDKVIKDDKLINKKSSIKDTIPHQIRWISDL